MLIMFLYNATNKLFIAKKNITKGFEIWDFGFRYKLAQNGHYFLKYKKTVGKT